MGKNYMSREAYTRIADEVVKKGSATHAGEQRHKKGLGLHELVDPKGFGVIRRSISWLEPEGDHFILFRGTAILEETRLDSTGSMRKNVQIAMEILPSTFDLLVKVPEAVLSRYDTQMITSIFGDVCDNYVLCRSQAEVDESIAQQMTLMLPEGEGGDSDEDPQYGLFGAAYLTKKAINDVGLKSYDFTITDARGRSYLTKETLIRVFGETVFEKVRENGFEINEAELPSTKEVVNDLLKSAHAFILLVNSLGPEVNNFWKNIYGSERVVIIPRVELLPEIKAAIIGLTEGVLSLQTTEAWLIKNAKLTASEAKSIVRSISHIPIGAQAELPNFNKVPLKGDFFAKKGDIWPMDKDQVTEIILPGEDTGNDENIWK